MVKRLEREEVDEPKVKQGKTEKTEAKSISVRRNYAALYRAVKDARERDQLFNQVKDEENIYRELFAQERNSKELKDPLALLVDVHEHEDIFKFVAESEEESKIPRISASSHIRKPEGDPCVVSKKEFDLNFDLFTEGQFREMNWENVLIAGGSILACLQPHAAQSRKDKRNYFHKDAYKNSDIDIFFYGLDAKQANKKMIEIYENVCDSLIGGEDVICFRSQHAVTIISKFPYRHIQIILRLYKSPAEILMGFDVDACAIGYNGKSVLMTPRAHHAITYQVNTVDMTRRSPSYEMRLAKYTKRGYAVLVPTLNEQNIDPQIFEKRFDQVQGLAKLILITKLETVEARFAYKERQRARRLRSKAQNQSSFLDLLDCDLTGEDLEYNSERLESGAAASDYSTVFLPWGPKWHAKRIRKLMYTKDMILNSKWYDPNKKFHTHPCFFGTAKEVISDCCGTCPKIPEVEYDPDSPYVSGEISWLEVNPGQQTQLKRIGSFHPITEGDWTEGTYISSEIEGVCAAVNSNNVEKLKEICKSSDSIDLNLRDSSGRTPLHIACFSNSVDVAKYLIDQGARVSSKIADGRSALHICAQYGHYEIISALITRGAILEEEYEKYKAEHGIAEEPKVEESEMDIDDDLGEDSGTEDDNSDESSSSISDDSICSDDGMSEEFCIKDIVDKQKKSKQNMETMTLNDDESKPDLIDIEERDWDNKFTALQFACFYGRTKAISVLIDEAGADVCKLTDSKKFTMAMLATMNGHLKAVKALLKRDYPLEHKNSSKITLIEFACSQLCYPIVKYLISQHSDKITGNYYSCMYYTLRTKIPDNDSAEEKKKERIKIIKLLLNNGASFINDDPKLLEDEKQTTIRKNVGNNGAFTSLGHCLLSDVIDDKKLVKLFLDHDPTIVNLCDGDNTFLDKIHNSIKQTELEVPYYYERSLSAILTSEEPLSLELYDSIITKLKSAHKKAKNSITKRQFFEDALTELYNDLAKRYRTKSIVPKKAQKVLDGHKEQMKKRKKLQEVEAILVSHGAKRFTEIRFTDSKMKKLFNQKKKQEKDEKQENNEKFPGYEGDDEDEITIPSIDFRPISETQRTSKYDKKQAKAVCELFDAIIAGDAKKIKKLACAPPIGKQTHVSTYAKYSEFERMDPSTLIIATRANNADLVRLLVEIAVEQFTPLVRTKKKDEFIPSINNHDLLKLMKQEIKPGDYLDSSGFSIFKQEDFNDNDDPNEKSLVKLNCTTSPSKLILFNSKGLNVLHVAAYYDCVEAASVLLDIIVKKKISFFRIIDSDDAKANRSPDTSTKALINELIFPTESGYNECKLTPLQIAICRGNTKIAKFLLENGGMKLIVDDDDKDIYTGLNVGGEKMDWALDHHASDKNEEEKETKAILLAAYFNQPKMIEFLVKDAPAIWKEYCKTTHPDCDVSEAEELKLSLQDSPNGYSPLHICSFWYYTESCLEHYDNESGEKISRTAAAKKILELDSELYGNVLINLSTKTQGLTPLMIASHYDNIEITRLLISHKALVDCQCNKRGWTALHYAVANNSKECVKELIIHFTESQVNLKSNNFLQTALMIAAHNRNKEIVKILLDSKKCNILSKDFAGDFALHYAVRKIDIDCVKGLLEVEIEDSEYLQENGVNQTVLDAALLIMLKCLRKSKKNFEKLGRAAQVLQLVYHQLGYERCLSQYKYINCVTELLIKQTIEQCEADLKYLNDWNYESPTNQWTHFCKIDNLPNIYMPQPFQDSKPVLLRDISTKNFLPFY